MSGMYTTVPVSANNGINDDKQWLAADANPSSPFRDNLYLVWTEFTNPWQILFSRSTDQGVTWSAPVALSPADNDGDGAVDEDAVDGVDNDGDTLVDEDPPEGDTWPLPRGGRSQRRRLRRLSHQHLRHDRYARR